MQRRKFLTGAVSATVAGAVSTADAAWGAVPRAAIGGGRGSEPAPEPGQATGTRRVAAMAVGLIIQPANGAEAAISKVHELGMTNCFLSLDGYLGKYSKTLADELNG